MPSSESLAMSGFRAAVIEPTLRCNLHCPMCDRALSTRRTGELTREEAAHVAAVLPRSVQDVMISGGEPTLWRPLPDFVSALVRRGARVTIQTNGSRPKVIERVLALGAHGLNVSIDGPRAVHEAIRGPGTFDLAIECIRLARAARRSVVTTTIMSGHNVLRVSPLFSQLKLLRARPQVMLFELERRFDANTIARSAELLGVSRSQVAVQECDSAMPPYTSDTLRDAIDRVRSRSQTYRQKILFLPSNLPTMREVLHARELRSRGRCECEHKRVLRVDPRGRVVPCFTFRVPLGNLLEQGGTCDLDPVAWDHFWRRLSATNLTPACETCFRAKPVLRPENHPGCSGSDASAQDRA